MAFPDSAKKAPNVFFNTIDGTGAPSSLGTVIATSTAVFNLPPHPATHSEFVTSAIYPLLTVESARVGPVSAINGYELSAIIDNGVISPLDIISGSLTDTLVFVVYNNAVMENIAVSPLDIISGSLTETLIYIVYNNAVMENIAVSPLTIINGSLV